MLVLTRAKDEAIMIGDDIEITVVEVRGDRVRLGIRAPQHVSIHRKEVYVAIRDANLEAARADAAGLAGLGDLGKTLPGTATPGSAAPPKPGESEPPQSGPASGPA